MPTNASSTQREKVMNVLDMPQGKLQRIIEPDLENDFPSLDLAYDIAIAAFETSQKRMDAVDGKTQSLTTMCVASFFAVPTIAKALNIPFASVWFALALLLIAASVIVGVVALKSGKIDRLDPAVLFSDWLDLPKGQFMKDAIYYSGESLDSANTVIERKWSLHNLSLILYFVALLASAAWLAGL